MNLCLNTIHFMSLHSLKIINLVHFVPFLGRLISITFKVIIILDYYNRR